MARTATLATCAAVATLVCAGLPVQAQSETYNRVDEVMDWGATTTKLILDLGAEVPSGAVDADSFSVTVKRSDPRLEQPLIEEGELEVTEAYISDAEGNAVEAGRYATLVPKIGPAVTLSQALNYAPDPEAGRELNAWTRNEYTITQRSAIGDVEGLVATEMDQYARPLIDAFEFASASVRRRGLRHDRAELRAFRARKRTRRRTRSSSGSTAAAKAAPIPPFRWRRTGPPCSRPTRSRVISAAPTCWSRSPRRPGCTVPPGCRTASAKRTPCRSTPARPRNWWRASSPSSPTSTPTASMSAGSPTAAG